MTPKINYVFEDVEINSNFSVLCDIPGFGTRSLKPHYFTAENVKLGKLFIDYTWYAGSAFLALVHLVSTCIFRRD